MGVIQRVAKPTTRKGKRALLNKQPKIIENPKQTLFIPGRKNNEAVSSYMKTLYALKKPNAIFLSKKNDAMPFEDVTPIEQLCNKYDASLFCFCSHNKKRPNNFVMGRLFDGHLLDMFEFGIEPYCKTDLSKCFKPNVGVKPCLIFNGEDFEQYEHLSRFKSLVVDMFRHHDISCIEFEGIEYVMSFTAVENKILLRSYKVVLENAGSRTPFVTLEIMSPSINLIMRRKILASDDLYKRAFTKPKTKSKKIKNIKRDAFGSQLGRIHMTSQNVNKLQTRKMKGLRKSTSEKKDQKKRKIEGKWNSSKKIKVAKTN